MREPVGPYESENFADAVTTAGALIHFQPEDEGGDIANLTRTQLVAVPPAAANLPTEAAVALGASWTDVFSGLTIGVASGMGSALSVAVSRDNACFTLGSSTATIPGNGGTATVQVSAPGSCSWTASTSDLWISIESAASGTGDGTVTFLAAPNSGQARQGLLKVGGRGVLISQAAQNVAPTVLPLNPPSVSGASAFLNFLLMDQKPMNYSTVSFNISAGAPSQPVCNFSWDEPGQQFLLVNDDGVTTSSTSADSFLIDLENSTCAVLIALPGFYGDLSQFSMQVEVVWKKPTGAAQTIYLRAQDLSGNDTGWQKVGSWTVVADQPPSQPVMADVPGVGFQHLFTIQAADPDGAGDIRSVELNIGAGSHVCSMIFLSTISAGVEFLNDDGTRSAWVAHNPATASNSYCSLDLLPTQSTASGDTETVLLPVTFLNTLAGEQPVQVIVADWSGKTGTLNTTWNVAPSSAPPAISVGGIVNGASWQPGALGVGEIVTIFGSGLGPSKLQSAIMVDKELQQTVAGTTVFLEGTPVPLIYASDGAVSAIVPPNLLQPVHVEVASAGGLSNVVTVPYMSEFPGIFTYANSQQAVVVNQDSTFNIDTPASPGSYITFFITGAGYLDYDNAEYLDFGGLPPSNPWATPTSGVLVQFGDGAQTAASFAGLTFPGVVQVNAYIDPSTPPGDAVPLQVSMPDFPGPNITSPAATVRIK